MGLNCNNSGAKLIFLFSYLWDFGIFKTLPHSILLRTILRYFNPNNCL